MNAETPVVAYVLRHLRTVVGAVGEPPTVDPNDEGVHAAFFLIQEVAKFPLEFRFKGSHRPYSNDLAGVLSEYLAAPDYWQTQAGGLALREDATNALRRAVEQCVPDNGDRRDWQLLTAAYLFMATSPTHLNGRADLTQQDFARLFGTKYSEADVADAAQQAAGWRG